MYNNMTRKNMIMIDNIWVYHIVLRIISRKCHRLVAAIPILRGSFCRFLDLERLLDCQWPPDAQTPRRF